MNDVARLLQTHGIASTAQRIEIATVLLAKPQHLSAEQVLTLVNERGAIVSKATVYNTLGLFARKGLVREVTIDPTKVFYDSNTDPHHHFFNVVSGELRDVEAGQLNIAHLPKIPDGMTCAGVDVVIRIRPSTDPDTTES